MLAMILASTASAADPCGQSADDGRAHGCVVREIALPPRAALAVDGRENGGISVVAHDRPEILIRAKVATTARTEADADELARAIEILSSDGPIRADGPSPSRDRHWSVSYEVSVPRCTDLDLLAHNGGIAVRGVDGQVAMQTTNGGIALRDVNGDVRGETTNGGVSVELSGRGWDGAGLDVRTTNGGIDLVLPQSYAADLQVSTVWGGVAVDGPAVRDGGRVAARLGGGGAPIRLTTTNGGVSVTSE